ncbi:hypothetical protein ACVWXL_008084 [Bradyrhizobium sp. GM22.5]
MARLSIRWRRGCRLNRPGRIMPFVVLTNHNEGARFSQFRSELVRRLRNLAFLERPHLAADGGLDGAARPRAPVRSSRLSGSATALR